MRATRPLLGLAVLLGVLASVLPLAAGGGGERASGEELSRVAVLVLGPAEGARPALPARLAMAIPPYLWCRFKVTAAGLERSVDARYREVGSVGSSRERVGELELERIELRIAMPERTASKERRLRISFDLADLLATDGSIRAQPADEALARAVRESGATGGEARVVSVTRSGPRSFVAEVLVR